MADTKNALDELAADLIDALTAVSETGLIEDRHVATINHAQLLVAELATIFTKSPTGKTCIDIRAPWCTTLDKCYEIAEEGGKMAADKDTVYAKYKILDAKTGPKSAEKYFVLKIDAKDPIEWCAVQAAMAMYADYHKRHGNEKYSKEVESYAKC